MADEVPPVVNEPPTNPSVEAPTDPILTSSETAPVAAAAAAEAKDIAMTDAAAPAISPDPATTDTAYLASAHQATPSGVVSPAAAPRGASSSRAASAHPQDQSTPAPSGSVPTATLPAEAPPHGAPVRQYLNGKVTNSLLEGMKLVAKEQPKDPLRVLGEFLLQKSQELETE